MADFHAADREAAAFDPLAGGFDAPPPSTAPPARRVSKTGAPVEPPHARSGIDQTLSETAALTGEDAVLGEAIKASLAQQEAEHGRDVAASLFGVDSPAKRPPPPQTVTLTGEKFKGLDATKLKFKQKKGAKAGATSEGGAGAAAGAVSGAPVAVSQTPLDPDAPPAPTTNNRLGLGVDFSNLGDGGAAAAGERWDKSIAAAGGSGADAGGGGGGIFEKDDGVLTADDFERTSITEMTGDGPSKLLVENEDDEEAKKDVEIGDLMVASILEREGEGGTSAVTARTDALFGTSSVRRKSGGGAGGASAADGGLVNDELLTDKGDDLLTRLAAATVSSGGKTAKPAAPATSGEDDLFAMLGDSGGGGDIVGDAKTFDFNSYINQSKTSGSGGLFD